MTDQQRRQLNHRIRAFAHGTLKMDEEAYRQVIRDLVRRNVEHITECTDEEAKLVLAALRRFQPGRALGGRQRGTINAPQHGMIAKLMSYLDWNWQHTAGFCERITGKPDTRKCTAAELVKVTQGMIAMIEQKIQSGELQLTHTELFEFRRHTRKLTPSPLGRAGVGSKSEEAV